MALIVVPTNFVLPGDKKLAVPTSPCRRKLVSHTPDKSAKTEPSYAACQRSAIHGSNALLVESHYEVTIRDLLRQASLVHVTLITRARLGT
jgi:hypothetical protein